MTSIGSICCNAASVTANAFPKPHCVGRSEVGLVIRPAVGGPLLDVEYLACVDDFATCARLAAQLQKRLERSAAEADDCCLRMLRRHLRLVH